jgi:DNA-directed RNA polymerase sigma subunit (sigma70/sigma32)
VADKESKTPVLGIPADDIDRALESLTARERKVIELRCGLKGERTRTREEIARYYGVIPTRIQLIENQALEKLRLWSLSGENMNS